MNTVNKSIKIKYNSTNYHNIYYSRENSRIRHSAAIYKLEHNKRVKILPLWQEQRFLDEENSEARRVDQRITFRYSL